ncbi:MAG: hypothetical protein HZB16_05940 [Armatimonadetes bacterium]|nr:hypothetical protein [Armatimonadota bacterium]
MSTEPGFDLAVYARVLRRRFPLFAVPVVLLTLLVGGGSFMLPDIYRATATVIVRSEGEATKGLAVATEITKQLGGVVQALRQPAEQKRAFETVKKDRPSLSLNSAIEDFEKGLLIESKEDGQDLIVTISFTSTPQSYCLSVVNAFAAEFKRLGEQLVANSLDVSVDFVSSQLATQKQRMADLEQRRRTVEGRLASDLGDLAARIDDPDLPKAVSDRLREDQANVDRLAAQVAALETQTARLRQEIATTSPTSSAVDPPEGSSEARLDAAIGEARSRRAALLARYTEQHPQVAAIDRELVDLERRRAEARAEALRRGQRAPSNPAYEQLRRDLVPVEGQLVAARTERSRVEGRVARLSRIASELPTLEKELSGLKTEQAAVKATYAQLLERKQNLDVNQSFEESRDSGRFEVRPAGTVPPPPKVAPARPTYLAAGLLVGLAMGLGFVLLAEWGERSQRV